MQALQPNRRLKMFEVGKTYETKNDNEFECIAVTDCFAWLKTGKHGTAYVWTLEGQSVSLSHEFDIKPKPREYWIGPISRLMSDYEQPGMIHVREVLE